MVFAVEENFIGASSFTLVEEIRIENLPQYLNKILESGTSIRQIERDTNVSTRTLRRCAQDGIIPDSYHIRDALLAYVYAFYGGKYLESEPIVTISRADHAFNQSQWQSARSLYQEALEFVENAHLRSEIELKLAKIAVAQHRFEDAELLLSRLNGSTDGYLHDRMMVVLGSLKHARRDSDAREILHQSLSLMEKRGDYGEALNVLVRLMGDYYYAGEHSMYSFIASKAKAVALHLRNLMWLSVIVGYDGHHYRHNGELEKALASYSQSLEIAQIADKRHQIARAHARIGQCLIDLGRLKEAHGHIDACEEVASIEGYGALLSYTYALRAQIALQENNSEDGLALAEKAAEMAEQSRSDKLTEAYYALMLACRAVGDDERADEVAKKGVQSAGELGYLIKLELFNH